MPIGLMGVISLTIGVGESISLVKVVPFRSVRLRAAQPDRLGRSITGVHMEARTEMDLALDHQLAQRRESALAAIARYRTPTGAAIIPVWFALFVALLIAFVPNSRPNPIPYVVAMLSFAVVWVTVMAVRNNRRLEAIVQLITQNDSHGVAKT